MIFDSQIRLAVLFFPLLLLSEFFTPRCFANSSLDRQYRLESLGLLRSTDNIDHILSDYVEVTYQDFFQQQSRFQATYSKPVHSILNQSKIPDHQIFSDPDLLSQIARVSQVETLLRTRIVQTGKVFHFKLDWLHAPRMETLATLEFDLEAPRSGGSFEKSQFKEAIQKHLSQLISQVPFQGQITGRDRNQVTLNLGSLDGIQPGDTLTIATLEGVKKHPLLRQISEWKLAPTGKVKIEKVEQGMSFGVVLEEEPGRKISSDQKVVFTQHLTLDQSRALASNSEQITQEPSTHPTFDPQIGWGAFSLPMGSYERSFSSQTPALSTLGNRFTYGGRVEGNLLLNKDFFNFIRLGYQSWNYQQTDTSSGQLSQASKNGGVPGSQTSALFSLGYQISLTHSTSGPKGWVSLGYKITSFTLPISTQEATAPTSFKSLLLGAGIQFNIKANWTLQTSLRYRILTSVSAENLIGQASTTGTSDVEFYLGALYQWNDQFALRGGLEIQSLSAEFNGASSLSQKTMTFAPALLYYF